MTLDDAAQEISAVKVEVFNPETPFGGVQIFGVTDAPIQVEFNTGSPVQSVFGRVGAVQPLCGDYDQCYARVSAGIPEGGLPGQVLTKSGDDDFQADWDNPTGGGGGGGSINASGYRFSTSTTASDPGNNNLRFNNATPASVSQIYIDSLNDESVDISGFLGLLKVGDIIAVQDKSNSADAFRFRISGALTNNTGWWTIPVAYVSSQGSIPANNAQVVVITQMGGGTIAATTNLLKGDGSGNAVATSISEAQVCQKQTAYPTPTTINEVIACLRAAGLCI